MIPYGVSSFEEVIKENMYYVDKTKYIPMLEQQPKNLFFIRPRRFGKSLFINMLIAYYDVEQNDRFNELFGDLWIGSHPTPNQGRFQVMTLDFSRVTGDIEHIEEKFDEYLSMMMTEFAQKYEKYYYPGFAADVDNGRRSGDGMINFINEKAQKHGCPIYLIIDEYDNFTNIILNEKGESVYHAITHASGFYRDLFKKFKGMCNRIFLTGVSPVTLDDLTSGFNIGWHLSTNPKFNAMLGFTQDDVRTMFRYYQEVGWLEGDIEEMIGEMKPWYDNYCFAKTLIGKEHVFNSDMVLYYLSRRVDTGQSPEEMIDPNTRTDYNKMKKLIQLDKLDGDRKGVLRHITEEGQITAPLFESFPASEIVKPDIFPSLLFYYGMLTLKGTRGKSMILGIPNNNVRKQYYEYALEDFQQEKELRLGQLDNYYYDMAFDGHWQEALDYIARSYTEHSSVRSAIEGERNIQGYFTAYLSINAYYLTHPEVEVNHGFMDMFLMPDHIRYPEVAHSYILELKYLPAKDFESKAEAQWQEAVTQIHGYAEGERVKALCRGTQMHRIVMQFAGWELKRMEEV